MKKSWWLRFSFLMVLAIVSIVTISPTVFNFKESDNFPVKSKINLGLDLQGGLYMILGIDFKKVYKDEVKGYARKVAFLLKDNGIESEVGELLEVEGENDPRHTVILRDVTQIEKAESKVQEFYPGVLRLVGEEGNTLTYALSNITKTRIEEQSVGKSIEVIRNRIDEFGVTEPEIVSQGSDRIVVQLPGIKDIDRAKDLIGKTAKLEFKIVEDKTPGVTLLDWVKKAEEKGIKYKKGERFSIYVNAVNEYLREENLLPKGFEMAFQKTLNKLTNDIESTTPFLVEEVPKVTGDDLQDAFVSIDPQKNEPYVSMNFKPRGAKLFEQVTGDNIGKRLAVILDGNVYTAPSINDRIGGGRAQITLGSGNYNSLLKQARDIALVLRAGALPVQLDFLEQRIVGPSLGQDSIQKARFAAIVGSILVFIFIFIYYRVSGVIALFSLALNVIFILAILVGLEATLTLPGIAGIALTVGMAVDANIIIYERIREEVRKGISNYKAVENGFESAFWTIIDANITTALAGMCLLNFGTGPIRGFAVTLLIGIVATVYTSYFFGRMMFEFYMNKVEGQDLSI